MRAQLYNSWCPMSENLNKAAEHFWRLWWTRCYSTAHHCGVSTRTIAQSWRIWHQYSVEEHFELSGRWTHALIRDVKSRCPEITEDSITGLRKHSVDMGASAPTCSSIKSEVIQPARSVALDRMTRNTRSFAEVYMEERDQLQQCIGTRLEPERLRATSGT